MIVNTSCFQEPTRAWVRVNLILVRYPRSNLNHGEVGLWGIYFPFPPYHVCNPGMDCIQGLHVLTVRDLFVALLVLNKRKQVHFVIAESCATMSMLLRNHTFLSFEVCQIVCSSVVCWNLVANRLLVRISTFPPKTSFPTYRLCLHENVSIGSMCLL